MLATIASFPALLAIAAAPPPAAGHRVTLPHRRGAPTLRTRRYVELTVARTALGLTVRAARFGTLPPRQELRRYRGPFEIRLHTAGALRDVVSFSFPLTLAAGERTPPNVQLDRSIHGGVSATATVRVPYIAELTHLLLLDRQRQTRTYHHLGWLQRRSPLPAPALPAPRRTDSFR